MDDQPTPRFEFGAGARWLLTFAALVIVIAGLKAAAGLLLPIMLAVTFAILCMPSIHRLRGWGAPRVIAVTVVVGCATLVLLVIGGLVGDSIAGFQDALPAYKEKVGVMAQHVEDWLKAELPRMFDENFDIDKLMPQGSSAAADLLQFVGNTTGALVDVLSNFVIILLITFFVLFEADGLDRKLRRALKEPDSKIADITRVVRQINTYMSIKGAVSLLTGALVALSCWLLDVDFPLLWGLVALLFNFIPNIGSIIAAVPACLLSLIQHGIGTAFALGVAYAAINLVVGNILEPRWMGRRLGLSTLVVFLSLLVWSWVLGPVGMLLSVPLTVILKIVLEQTSDLRFIAVLLGPSGEEPS